MPTSAAAGSRRGTRRACAAALLSLLALLPHAPSGAATATREGTSGTKPAGSPGNPRGDGRDARVIEMHVGIPGVAYIGQPLQGLLARFPQAQVTPFAQQDDAAVVKIADAGISCYVVGDSPDGFAVASVGFNLADEYQGVAGGSYVTGEGIGRGSTVNDLLGTYGRPSEITGERTGNPAMRGRPKPEDPNEPKKYHYPSSDGAVKTYFMVEGSRVTRVVINHLAPLDKHILRRPPGGPPPSPAPPRDPA